jgi:hypothetical protein
MRLQTGRDANQANAARRQQSANLCEWPFAFQASSGQLVIEAQGDPPFVTST